MVPEDSQGQGARDSVRTVVVTSFYGYDWRLARREGWEMSIAGRLYWTGDYTIYDDEQVRDFLIKKVNEGSEQHAAALVESTKRKLLYGTQ